MTPEMLSVGLGILAVAGQAIAVYLNLKLRVLILESEERGRREARETFVSKETFAGLKDLCEERHKVRAEA